MKYLHNKVIIVGFFVLLLDLLSFYFYRRSFISFFIFYPRVLLHESLKRQQILYQKIAIAQRVKNPPTASEMERMREDHTLCFSVADCIDDPNQLADGSEVSDKNKYYCRDRRMCEGNDCTKYQACSRLYGNFLIGYYYTCRENKCVKKELLVTDPQKQDPWFSLLSRYIRSRRYYYLP
jgi:hypothetical protein